MGGTQSLRNMSSSLMLAGLALVEVDCAGAAAMTSIARPREAELRPTVAVSDPAPQLLVSGPVVVLHMSVDRRRGGAVTVFRAPRHDGTAADCRSGPQHHGDVVDATRASLLVPANESLCAIATRPALVSWHARQP